MERRSGAKASIHERSLLCARSRLKADIMKFDATPRGGYGNAQKYFGGNWRDSRVCKEQIGAGKGAFAHDVEQRHKGASVEFSLGSWEATRRRRRRGDRAAATP